MVRKLLGPVLAALAFPVVLAAQSQATTGIIRGTVTDPQGAAPDLGLEGVGEAEVGMDANGYVLAELPGTAPGRVGLCAHIDTAPAFSGTGVNPRLVKGYDGGVIELRTLDDTLTDRMQSIVHYAERFQGDFADHLASTAVSTIAAALLTADVREKTNGDIYSQARLMMEECEDSDVVTRMQSLDTRLYLAEDILTKVDRASMAVSLEVRAPFLDPRVAEYAASLPCNYKLRRNKTKYILKRAVSELLPPFVIRRGKKGFGVPVAEWLKFKLRPLARDLLSPARVRRAGVFDPVYVERLLDEHERGIANHRKVLWTLLMFELWHESFIETPRRIETSVNST